MPHATWLADVLRDEGLHVVTLDGWQTRETRPGFDPCGLVWHHTATPKSAADSTVRKILRDGRTDLPGPLSQLGLERDGTYVVVAAGRCNHNGFGLWGNDSIGIEAYNDGIGEPWPQVQLDAFDRGTAAICRRLGWDPLTQVKAHRETDPGRKVDPNLIDMAKARGRVLALLTPAPPPPQQEDDDMLIFKAEGKPAFLLSGGRAAGIKSNTDVGNLKKAGVPEVTLTPNTYNEWLTRFRDPLPVVTQ